jgi:membrane-associated protein
MENILNLLLQYRYFILFPLAIIEGPILAVISGFLCVRGFLNPWIVLPVIVFGDVIGDSICFAFGKWGVPEKIKKFIYWIGPDPARVQRVKWFIEMHPKTIIPLSKLTLGIGVVGIYLIGNSGVTYKKFFRVCLLTSLFQYIFYLGIGLLFGHAYAQINRYMNYAASLTIILFLVVVLFFIIHSIRRKL